MALPISVRYADKFSRMRVRMASFGGFSGWLLLHEMVVLAEQDAEFGEKFERWLQGDPHSTILIRKLGGHPSLKWLFRRRVGDKWVFDALAHDNAVDSLDTAILA